MMYVQWGSPGQESLRRRRINLYPHIYQTRNLFLPRKTKSVDASLMRFNNLQSDPLMNIVQCQNNKPAEIRYITFIKCFRSEQGCAWFIVFDQVGEFAFFCSLMCSSEVEELTSIKEQGHGLFQLGQGRARHWASRSHGQNPETSRRQ